MYLRTYIHRLNILLVFVLAFMVVLGPTMAEARAETISEIQCESVQDQELPSDDHKKEHKIHHVHSCGSCHFHANVNLLGRTSALQLPIRITRHWANVTYLNGSPIPLFRPPRH